MVVSTTDVLCGLVTSGETSGVEMAVTTTRVSVEDRLVAGRWLLLIEVDTTADVLYGLVTTSADASGVWRAVTITGVSIEDRVVIGRGLVYSGEGVTVADLRRVSDGDIGVVILAIIMLSIPSISVNSDSNCPLTFLGLTLVLWKLKKDLIDPCLLGLAVTVGEVAEGLEGTRLRLEKRARCSRGVSASAAIMACWMFTISAAVRGFTAGQIGDCI